MSLQFEWDPRKAKANFAKHGVSFEEAMTVFADPLARIFNDETHSMGQKREIIIGHSKERRLLLVSFTGPADRIRVISARVTTRREQKDYEENLSS